MREARDKNYLQRITQRRMGRMAMKQTARNKYADFTLVVYLSHGIAAVLAFVAGKYYYDWANTTTTRKNCMNWCRCHQQDQKKHLLQSKTKTTLHGTKENDKGESREVISLLKKDIVDQFSVQPWFDADETPSADRNDESVLLVRPPSSSSSSPGIAACRSIDLIWLDSSKQNECLAILLPCRTNIEQCHQFTSSVAFGHLYRLAPPAKQHNQWSMVPWQHVPSSSLVSNKNRKPFRLETPPKPVVLHESWDALGHYLQHLPRMLNTLENLVDSIDRDAAEGAPITILLSNKGHIDLLLNFVCAWHGLPLDSRTKSLDHIIVFAVDQETQQVASQLNLKVFHDPAWLHGLQADSAAASYGTHSYAILMLAKVYCAHMMSTLGRDFVFHDVDIIPLRRDYLSPLLDSQHAAYDLCFQYDFPGTGSADQMQPEYRPWLINSGLYLVRSNTRTRRFFADLVRQTDLVLRSNSHQVVMNFLISQHASSRGLKVKVLRHEADLLPGGYHFHKRWEFMHAMLNGTIHPYLFHMNYNENKETKRKFNEQIGTWFVEKSCSGSLLEGSVSIGSCCNFHPEPQCYYRDKPSKHPCPDSPLLEEGMPFW